MVWIDPKTPSEDPGRYRVFVQYQGQEAACAFPTREAADRFAGERLLRPGAPIQGAAAYAELDPRHDVTNGPRSILILIGCRKV